MFPYFDFAVGFMVVVYIFETFLDVRQLLKSLEKDRPPEIRDIITEDKFTKAQAYAFDKNFFGLFTSFFGETKNLLMLLYGTFPWLWQTAGSIDSLYFGHEITQSLIFLLLYMVIETLFDLPFSLYSAFVIEEKYGFNKQTLQLFFSDMLKTIGLSIVIGAPVVAGMIYVIQQGGELFYIYVWIFVSIVQLVMLAIYPNVIQPLFNTVTPLEDSSLKTKIEALAKRLEFPLTKLYVIDGSKRSGHSNAYYYGFFKNKRIVLFDTLMNQMEEEEVVAVLGHELGHWKLNHVVQNLIISEAHLLVLFYLFGQFLNNQDLYISFGFDSKPVIIGLFLFQLIYSPVAHVLDFLMHVLSRRFEFEADAFAKKLGFAAQLRTGLIKLQLENLGNMNPDPWYSAFHYSHPPLVERLKAMAKVDFMESWRKQ